MLSGGLASGKSHVRKLLAEHGIWTLDADSVGHQLLEPGGEAVESITDRWPAAVSAGTIDRGVLASIVFKDPSELRELEAITHPLIFGTIQQTVEEIRGPAVVELPLLKSLGDEWSRIVVDVEPANQLRWAIDRGMDEDDAQARLQSQPARSEWLAAADVVVPNHGSREDLELTVMALLDDL